MVVADLLCRRIRSATFFTCNFTCKKFVFVVPPRAYAVSDAF